MFLYQKKCNVMKKIINIFSLLFIIIFFFLTINYYFSNSHIEMIKLKRDNYDIKDYNIRKDFNLIVLKFKELN